MALLSGLGHFECPRCAGKACSKFYRNDQIYWHSSGCRYQSSLRAGTAFEHSRLPLRTSLLAMYLLSQGKTDLSALELMRHLGVSYPAAWRLKHKLMQAMSEREMTRKLGDAAQSAAMIAGGMGEGVPKSARRDHAFAGTRMTQCFWPAPTPSSPSRASATECADLPRPSGTDYVIGAGLNSARSLCRWWCSAQVCLPLATSR